MKTAIITGATSGIGLKISQSLLELDYKVYGIGRNFSKNPITSKNFIPITSDLQNTENLSKLINSIRKNENIYALINNAGVGYFGLHEELNPKKIHEMITINLEVPLILTQLLLRDLKKVQGYIINVSSITAKKSNPHGCAYGATKAGLTSFSTSLFDEARKYGIKVSTIHPDITKSDFYRNSNFQQGNTLDTYLLPEEVAKAVTFILTQREGMIISDFTIQPQKHRIEKKS